MEEDLNTLGMEDWREIVQDRDRGRNVVMAATTFRE